MTDVDVVRLREQLDRELREQRRQRLAREGRPFELIVGGIWDGSGKYLRASIALLCGNCGAITFDVQPLSISGWLACALCGVTCPAQ